MCLRIKFKYREIEEFSSYEVECSAGIETKPYMHLPFMFIIE